MREFEDKECRAQLTNVAESMHVVHVHSKDKYRPVRDGDLVVHSVDAYGANTFWVGIQKKNPARTPGFEITWLAMNKEQLIEAAAALMTAAQELKD